MKQMNFGQHCDAMTQTFTPDLQQVSETVSMEIEPLSKPVVASSHANQHNSTIGKSVSEMTETEIFKNNESS